jgi:hypothetical protein
MHLLNNLSIHLNYRLKYLTAGFSRGWRSATFPRVLVNGSPKTGTTWMYRMVGAFPGAECVGNFTGQIERYLELPSGAVVHGHEKFSEELAANLDAAEIKTVLLFRDPRDQAVSRMFHIRRSTTNRFHAAYSQLDHDALLMACIQGREADRFPGIRYMVGLTQGWINSGYPIQVVRYEDMLADPVGKMSAAAHWIGIPAGDGLIKAIVQKHDFQQLTIGRNIFQRGRKPGEGDPGSHFRRGVAGDWRNHFTPGHIEACKEICGSLLVEWGYEENQDWQ